MQTMTSQDIDQVAGGTASHLSAFLSAAGQGNVTGDGSVLSDAIRIAEVQRRVQEERREIIREVVGKFQ